MSSEIEKLASIFYNPKMGLINSSKLYKKAVEHGVNLTKKEVDDFYKKQPISQVVHRTVKPKKFTSIQANYVGNIYQMDVIVYDRYKMNNYSYILVVIDIYSRYMDARAMTNRRIETLFENFSSIIHHMGKPDKVECDNEFNKQLFNEYFKANNITPIYSDPDQLYKNAIVERVNQTIANQLQKIRITSNNYKWYQYLNIVVDNYNETYHSTIKATPEGVFKGKESNNQVYEYYENNFQVNDKVRIKRKRKTFDKGDEIKYSKDIYFIEAITPTRIKLKEFEKMYKPDELLKVYEVEEREDVITPKNEKQNNKIDQYMKREDLKQENIIEGKTRSQKLKSLKK